MLHLLATLIAAPGTFNAAQHIPPGGDLADAIEFIQRHPDCSAVEDRRHKAGCRIQIPRGVFRTKTIHLCRGVILEGVTGAWHGSTVLEFDGVHGIRLEPPSYCHAQGFSPPEAVGGEQASAEGAIVQHLALRDVSSGVGTATTAGVLVEATHAALKHMRVDGFTIGVVVAGSVVAEAPVNLPGFDLRAASNANIWLLERVFISADHIGFYAEGPDANAGASILLSVIDACRQMASYPRLPACANIHDSSFLGNTHVASHTALGNGGYQYYTDSVDARNVFVGPYAEILNGTQLASKNDVIVGGSSGFDTTSQATILQNRRINGLCFPNGTQEICFGNRTGGGVLAAFAYDGAFHPSGFQGLRLSARTIRNLPVWVWDVAGLDAGVAMKIAATSSTTSAIGEVTFPKLRAGE